VNSRQLRARLVEELTAAGHLTSPAVRSAFLAVPRERFLPEVRKAEGLERVYRNEPIVTRLTNGVPTSSSSQPSIMARMLEELDVARGQRVLEVGLGTGYNAALLKDLVGPEGRVVSIDVEPDCVHSAREHLAGRDIETVLGNGYDGVPAHAPFDRIIVTASVMACPRAWWDQLGPDGRLVVPIRLTGDLEFQLVAALDKVRGGFDSARVIPGSFMSLRRPGDPAYQVPRSLSVTDHTSASPRPLIQLSGPALLRLTHAARLRLLAGALTPARTRRIEGITYGALLFLQLAIPSSKLIVSTGESGREVAVGLTNRRGTGLALVRFSWGGPKTLARLSTWGDPACAEELSTHLTAWRRAGGTALERFGMSVRYDRTPVDLLPPTKTIQLEDQTISVGCRQ
jgi:protein-L-isoaspartate(D-aspartate) O-methyltransferase